jgi:PAS domain S-box-containing protein
LIVRVKPDWTLTFVNDAYCRFVDKKREELIGQNAAQFVLDEDIQKGKKTQATLSPQNPVAAYQEHNVVAGGEIRWTEWRDRGIFDEQGNLVEIQSVARDITERKQAEEKLRNAERYMGIGQAAAMVGHDLRNPLQIIVNRLYLAKRAVKNLSSPYSEVAAKLGLEELFAELQYQASYMNKIVSDVQDYAKITHPEALETSLPKLLDDTFSTIDIPANVRVSREIDKDFPKLLIDPHLIRRALTNLIRNGIQSMPNGGQLIITASKTESNALISVQDTGVGIPQENLNKLFTPLFTSKAKGTGLGLPVSKRLVEAHGGSITVESKVGEGSIFTVKLPLNGEVEETHPNH